MSDPHRWPLAVPLTALLLALGCSSNLLQSKHEPDPSTASIADRQSANTTLASEAVTTAELESVHFDTDDASLRSDARATLRDHAEAILASPGWGLITVEGHCDERGTDAYNQALGEHRAEAVKRYLVELGVPPERLTTRSHGSSRPIAFGHDEGAWRSNRRSEFSKEPIASTAEEHRS